MNTILAKKQNMEQTFVDGKRVGVSIVEAGPCIVTQIKNEKRDGYKAVQLGFDTRSTKNVSKALLGHLRAAKLDNEAVSFLREVETEDDDLKVGDKLTVADVFSPGDIVTVTGVGKGKGFAGVVKRWGFAGGPKTHGQSDRHRAPGSIGQGTTPGRVYKGKKMAGRMGGETTSVKNLKVIAVDAENNILHISGSVPGRKGTFLMIQRTSPKQEVDAVVSDSDSVASEKTDSSSAE